MSEETQKDVTPEKKAPLEIIRGRMPVAVVYLVRFDHTLEESKALAQKFGTTVGKINDIKAISNFAYVTDSFKPTQAQKEEAIAWLKRHPYYDAQNVDSLVTMIDNMELATQEEAAAFASISKKAPAVTTKTGEIADGGGGNNIKGKKAKVEAPVQETSEPAQAPSEEELLA